MASFLLVKIFTVLLLLMFIEEPDIFMKKINAYANCKMSTNIAHPEYLEIETSCFHLARIILWPFQPSSGYSNLERSLF